jgi:hypothetical protein
MNINEIIPITNARMHRIQKVSKCIRLFLQYGIPLLIVGTLGFSALAGAHMINLPKPAQPAATTSGAGASGHAGTVVLWGTLCGILTLIVFFVWYRTALKLFGFFERGILFTAETVRCIQTLGVIYFVRFLVQLVLSLAVPSPVPSPDNLWLKVDLGNLFTSFLIIFIGWLIDEARKIREEQELTV